MKKIIGKVALCGVLAAFAAMPVMAENIDSVNTVDYVDEMIKAVDNYNSNTPMDISESPMVIAPNPMADAASSEYSVMIDNATLDLGENKIYVSKSGAVMIPVRAIAEKLGYTVKWDNANQGVNIDNGTINSTFYIGRNLYSTVSSIAIGMSAPASLENAPELINSTTYIPAKFFELLYCDVKLENNTVAISTENSGNNVQIPNPFAEYKTLDEAKKAVSFTEDFTDVINEKLSKDYKLTNISVMSGYMLQLVYENDNNSITYRVAQSRDDISGDYNEYKMTKTVKSGNYEITVRGNEKISGAVWNDGEFAYSVQFDNEISENDIINYIK